MTEKREKRKESRDTQHAARRMEHMCRKDHGTTVTFHDGLFMLLHQMIDEHSVLFVWFVLCLDFCLVLWCVSNTREVPQAPTSSPYPSRLWKGHP